MTTAQNNKAQSSQSATVPNDSPPSSPVSAAISKEHEVRAAGGVEQIKETSPKLEVAKEVEKAGVVKIGETIELPPDIKKLGVSHAGTSVPVAAGTIPDIVLPISDQQIVAGLHEKITSGIRWIAVWCIRKLKKAHLSLKVIHGKIARVKI